MKLKNGARFLGIDDGFFHPKKNGMALLVGIVQNASGMVEGVLSETVQVDGSDCTEKIISMCSKRFEPQLRAVFLSGLNFAGFNTADVHAISKKTFLPVIVVMKKKPCLEKVFRALEGFEDRGERVELFKKAGKLCRHGGAWFQFYGCTQGEAVELLKKSVQYSKVPECLRLAHIVASGTSIGESTRQK